MDPSAPRCLVFGGSGALGRIVCETLAAEGARVLFTWFSGEAAASELAAKLGDRGIALRVDLSSIAEAERAVDRAAEELGGIDALVQCAGVAIAAGSTGRTVRERMPQVDEAGWDRMMDVNVKSTFFACRRAVDVMRRGGGGNIVLIGSIDGVKPMPAPVHYAASKGALRAMAQAMAKEAGEFGIRVNMVAPGILEDGISRSLPEDLLGEYLKHCGLRRRGRFPEIAGLVAWLALRNTYVTAQTLLVDGAL